MNDITYVIDCSHEFMTIFSVLGQIWDMKHKNYEILNLLGYGLAKFGDGLTKELGFISKTRFYNFCVLEEIADTASTIKNRQDLFDPFFENERKGWWQKGDAYLHRKVFIDSLFGELGLKEYADVIRLYMKSKGKAIEIPSNDVSPILKSKFKQLQKTGREAELFFMNNYIKMEAFIEGSLEDARLLGDGYDFQIQVGQRFYLAEIKGLREKRGAIRMTEREYKSAKVYKDDYALIVVSNLSDVPLLRPFFNPAENMKFDKSLVTQNQVTYRAYI